jgi:CYTH domain-containing protein/CHAD domain-containing protein
MARESNAGRDAEVILAWLRTAEPALPARERGAAQWLIERFERQEREAESELAGRLSRDFDRTRKRLSERLSLYRVEAHVLAGVRETAFGAVVAAQLREHVDELRRRLKRIRTVDDVDEAHRARITGKRLRYMLEPVAAHVAGGMDALTHLRGLQDALGDLHDAHVWLSVLRHVVAELAMEEGRRMATALIATDKPKRRGASRKSPPRAGLVSLARMAHERSVEAFDRYLAAWGDRQARGFQEEIHEIAARLDAIVPRAVEIERKYLLKRVPSGMPASGSVRMEQGYVPGERLVERVRMVEEGKQRRYFRTIKVGTGLVRTELEEETTPGIFQALWRLTSGRRLTKRRHFVPDGDLVWEIDEFTDRSLVLAEVELPSADTTVEPPDWLAPAIEREVTGDPAYLNSTLAK